MSWTGVEKGEGIINHLIEGREGREVMMVE